MDKSDSAVRQDRSQTLPPGTDLKGLVVESVLGGSRFGNTYLTRDVELGKRFVLKEHLPAALCRRDPETLEVTPRGAGENGNKLFAWSVANFRKEAEAIAALNHPGIVRVLGGFEYFGTTYIAMPYVEGGSFAEQIRIRHADGPEFTSEELHGLLWHLLETLEVLHERGIFHEEIRPENVLLNEAGIPSLIGFSGARRRLCERIPQAMEKSGYTPIEQTTNTPAIGPQSDVFALGATLFAALTGKPPAVAKPIPLTRRLHLQTRFPQPLLASIDKALEPMSGDRFRDGTEWRRLIWGDSPGEESIDSPHEAEEERIEKERIEKERIEEERAAQIQAEQGRVGKDPLAPPAIGPATPSRSFALQQVAGALILTGILAAGIFGYFSTREKPSVTPEPPLASLFTSDTGPIAPPPIPADAPPLFTPGPIPPGAEASVTDTTVAANPIPPVGMIGSEPGEIRIFGGIEMVWCPPGTFAMGSPWNEKGRFMDETPHEVILTQGFWMAKTETTQKQWEVIIAENPSWRKGENLPVEKVTWSDVQTWLEKKNTRDPQPEGWKWSLPTEAQWEYACRAGTTTPIYSGPLEIVGALNAPALDAIAWYGGNSSVGYTGPGMETSTWKEKQYPGGLAGEREVGGKQPNAWGLHDMLGNVWEWCADWMGPYEIGTVVDPAGPATGKERGMRGGSWGNGPDLCRAAARNGNPGEGGDGLGFRAVIVPSPKAEP